MNLNQIFKRRKVDRLISKFSEFTSLPILFFDNDGKQVFSSIKHPLQLSLTSPILVNGEKIGYIKSTSLTEKNKLAFDFIKDQIEDILNSEFTKYDLVNTTANFWKELNFLYNLMPDIGSSFHIHDICNILIQKIIKALNAEKAQILLIENDDNLIPVAAIGDNESSEIEDWIIKTGSSVLLNDIENLPSEINKENQQDVEKKILPYLPLLIVPIKVSDRILGVLKVGRKKSQKSFSADDLKLLSAIGYQAALTINNLNMINKLRTTEKIEKEMELASTIQKEFLPVSVPHIAGLDIAGRCISANAVGGDYFDYFKGNNCYNFVLADVSGHGISAALFMSTVRSSLRGLFAQDLPLENIAYQLNNFIVSDSGTSGMFVTLFYMRYFPDDDRITYINSGQTPPVLIKNNGNSLTRLETGGSPAGFFSNMNYEVGNQTFEKGDLMVIYTDGFFEAENKNGIRFGEEKIIDIFNMHYSSSAENIIDKIYEEVYLFLGDSIQNDDMTIMAIKKVD